MRHETEDAILAAAIVLLMLVMLVMAWLAFVEGEEPGRTLNEQEDTMDVELIKMDPAVAREKLREYRKAIAARHHSAAARGATAEYEAIEEAYRAAARGFPLIELSKAMATGGWDERGRPRFAVARADIKAVRCYINANNQTVTYECGGHLRRHAKHEFRTRDWPARPVAERWLTLNAIVPLVPPGSLPRPDTDLSRRVILWEADWTAPPVDPLLLLPIGGDLYAVEASWDLTPLERAIISGRAS